MSLPPIFFPVLQEIAEPKDSAVMRLQQNLQLLFAQQRALNPFSDGQLLRSASPLDTANPTDGITFTGAQTLIINHRLGRLPMVVMVARDFGTNPANLVENKSAATVDSITMTSTATCTVWLWVK